MFLESDSGVAGPMELIGVAPCSITWEEFEPVSLKKVERILQECCHLDVDCYLSCSSRLARDIMVGSNSN